MGKAQSKRSVDITTETKKGAEDEVTEKMEKIEDLDKKEVLNGDATLEEKHDPQKKDNEEVENDKDMTTEKNVDIQAGGDSTEASNSAETPKDEGESATAEEISPLADESIKKSKKEKVKKKWSFRSISFGKKDKQKPSKNEEALDDGTPAINGAEIDDKSSNETEDPQKEKNVNEEVEKSTENRENGDATQQEINGTEHKDEMPSEEKSNVLTANLTTTNNTTTERCALVQSDTTVESTEQSEKTEPAVTSTTNNETNISENNTTNEVPKNGNGEFEELNATEQDLQKPDVTTASVETSAEKKCSSTDTTNELSASTNGEKIHQNGDNIDQEIVEQSKAQIEVNSKTENQVFAATLDSFPSTSINPSNAQIHIKDLNASTKNVDENFKINIDEPVIPKFSDIERVKCPNIIPTSSISESVETVEGTNYNKQVEESALLPTEIIETETTLVTADKICEPSPPPLPISPPPSQVSVFVFTNNEESVEDSLPTNSSKPDDSAINEESEEILCTHLEVLPDSGSLKTDIPENYESPDETIDMHNEIINESVEKKLIEEETSFEENMCTNSLSNKFRNEEEISIAAAVINEITEHAAEIVHNHLEIKENESLQKTDLKEDSNDKINNEVENVDHKGLAEDNNAGDCINVKSAEYLIESTVVPSQTIDSITDSSLTFSPKESTQAQNEMISLSVEEEER